MAASPVRHRRSELPRDGGNKRNPNSLALTLKLCREIPDKASGNIPRSKKKFIEAFRPYLESTIDRYPSNRQSSSKDLDQSIWKIEGNKISLKYYHMRAYAEYADVPVASLIMYAHVLGDAARGCSREEVERTIEAFEATIKSLRASLLTTHGDSKCTPRDVMCLDSPFRREGEINYKAKASPFLSVVNAIKAVLNKE